MIRATPAGQVALATDDETALFEITLALRGVLEDVEAAARLGGALAAAASAEREESALGAATDALVAAAAVTAECRQGKHSGRGRGKGKEREQENSRRIVSAGEKSATGDGVILTPPP